MISVCLATYNGIPLVLEQIQSILPQLSAGDELLVSDDGSTDGTVEAIRALQSPLIRLIDGAHQHSPIANFEHALRHAKGDIIFLADQDDKWLDGKVKTMVEALADCDCVVSDCIVTDGELNVTAPSFYVRNHTRHNRLYNLFARNGYLGCCLAFRRCVLDRALPFPRHTPMHDIWIGNISAWFYRLRFIDDRLMLFRRHDHNASPTARHSEYSMPRRFLFRFHVACALIRRAF